MALCSTSITRYSIRILLSPVQDAQFAYRLFWDSQTFPCAGAIFGFADFLVVFHYPIDTAVKPCTIQSGPKFKYGSGEKCLKPGKPGQSPRRTHKVLTAVKSPESAVSASDSCSGGTSAALCPPARTATSAFT